MKTYFKLFLLLLIPLIVIAGWYFFASSTNYDGSFPARADFSALVPDSTLDALSDSNAIDSAAVAPKEVDTTAQRILFCGDSMVEGLWRKMADYAEVNGHDITNVVWYSSNTRLWAETDTLQHFLNEVRPTYVLLCLGSNQLFVRNLPEVDKEIGRIVEKLGDIPFVWISPPNWKDDTGINDLIIKHVGTDRYFDSRHLTLARGRDHAHPTAAASDIWCDTICSWLSTMQTRHPLRLNKPEQKGSRKSRLVLLQPVH